VREEIERFEWSRSLFLSGIRNARQAVFRRPLVACPSFTATVFERSMAFVLERFQKEKQVSKTD
jgi:hypothetical protein